ncbi:MAG: DMT family transporter [Candidatus Shapirobacteria bacterium]
MNNRFLGIISLLSIGILFGLSGVIAKYLSTWLNPYQVVEYRFLSAFVVALIILFATKQKIHFDKINYKVLLAFALTFPISVIFFTLAIFNTSVSLAVFSFYISTLVTSFIIGKIYFKEKIDKNKQIALLFILLSIVCFTNPFYNFNIQIGFIFGIISGIFQTIASSFQKIVGKSSNRISLLILQTLTGVIVSVVSLLFFQSSLAPSLPTLPLVITIFFGAIFLLISYLFLVGFKYVDLNVGSILVSSELFFGPFFAYLILSQRLSTNEIIGGLLILAAVIFANRQDKRN